MNRGEYETGDDYDIILVRLLRLEKFKWVRIAHILGCTVRQLETWRKKVGFVDPRQSVFDAGLNTIYSITTMSAVPLNALVSRAQLRRSISRVDPIGREQRVHAAVPRVEY